MEITALPIDWTSTDADNFAKFLDTETGKRLIPRLADATPQLLDKGDSNAIMIRTGEVRGVGLILREILSLAHPPPPVKPDSNYPPPEDDRFWEGQKLNDPNPTIL